MTFLGGDRRESYLGSGMSPAESAAWEGTVWVQGTVPSVLLLRRWLAGAPHCQLGSQIRPERFRASRTGGGVYSGLSVNETSV